eukprot:gene9304-10910_t
MILRKLFQKKKVSMPVFESLEASTTKDMFFVRLKPWDWLTEKEIYVASKLNDRPTMITMEYWPQQIYLFANGQVTVSEFIHSMAKRFLDWNNPVPENFDRILLEEFEALVNEVKIVEFTDLKSDLPLEIELPMSRQLIKS